MQLPARPLSAPPDKRPKQATPPGSGRGPLDRGARRHGPHVCADCTRNFRHGVRCAQASSGQFLDQTTVQRHGHGGSARMHAQLAENVCDMGAGGAVADKKLLTDFLIALALSQ